MVDEEAEETDGSAQSRDRLTTSSGRPLETHTKEPACIVVVELPPTVNSRFSGTDPDVS